MNIGIVTAWFERGAAYVSRQYRDLLSKHFDIYIYARGGEEYALDDPIWDDKYVTWGKVISGIPLALDLDDFEKWIKEKNIGIILFNEQRWWEAVLFAKKMGLKTGGYVDYYTEETIPFFRLYDFLLCNTKRHYNTFNWHPQSYYLSWGTDISVFKPKSYDTVTKDCLTFFHSCGYSPNRKGTDQVLRAFSQLNCNAHLIIHSQVDLVKYYSQYEFLIKDLQNQGKLSLYNQTVSAPGLYKLGDVYVYPSRLDGIGLTIAEALASGLPVITSDNPPMNEFIDHSNGQLVRISNLYSRADGYYWPQCTIDIDDLVLKMKYYIENLREIDKFKRRARKYAEDYLDWNNHENELIDIIKKSIMLDEDKDIEMKARRYDRKRESFTFKLEKLLNRIQRMNELFDEIGEQKRIIIYGAGKHTEQMLKLSNISQKRIIAIVDKNYQEKDDLLGFNIKNPNIINELKPDTIIISSFDYQNTIDAYLRSNLSYNGSIIKLYNDDDCLPFYF